MWLLLMLIGVLAGPVAGGEAVRCPPITPKPSAQSSKAMPLVGPSPLRVEGRHFVDRAGRVVILRGVNLAGDSKVPPFAPTARPEDLDRIAALGFNVVRLLFLWEAYEPTPGVYDDAYLLSIRRLAEAIASRGLYVIIDVHQDGFSRYASNGSGDGFPRWAVSTRGKPSVPDNSPDCGLWPLWMATDPTTHKSFADFFDDVRGVRTRYLMMLGRLASCFATVPGVIGYDPINEPWGDERRELAPLYRDVSAVIRPRHPSAILFFEGHITTNTGVQSRLPRPDDGPTAYAPHYYNPSTILLRHWHGLEWTMDNAFAHMAAKSRSWNAPLFVGEIGMDARVSGCGDYIDEVYDRLDARLASGAHWNVTPGWTPHLKDGWNGEDFSILDPSGRLRPNYRPRPYPRSTAGRPVRFAFHRADAPDRPHRLEFDWIHQPDRGETVVFLPAVLFPPATSRVEVLAADPSISVSYRYDPGRQALRFRSSRPGPISVRVLGR